MISGHQRSGTTLLQQLCDRHPEAVITPEFGAFINYGFKRRVYYRRIVSRWLATRNRALNSADIDKGFYAMRNGLLCLRYLLAIARHGGRRVDLEAIQDGYQALFPQARVRGDKYPDYIYTMERYAPLGGLTRLVIYRDCRDVTSSTLRKVRTDWSQLSFIEKMDTAEKVATRWVEAMQIMEQHKDSLYIIRYEDLVTDPTAELERLGAHLGLDPAGFPANWIKTSSVGKHQSGLTTEELDAVTEIAGPTMLQWNYTI